MSSTAADLDSCFRPGDEALAYIRALEDQPFAHDFFQALRRIECLFPHKPRLGKALRPSDEPVRFGQEPSLAFAPAALSALTQDADGRPPRLEVSFFGLLGPNGPLPLHLTDFVISRCPKPTRKRPYTRERVLHSRDCTLPRFLDLFHHRLIELFYRAWAQAQPTVSLDRPGEDRWAAYVGALIGIGAARLRDRDEVGDYAKLYYSGLLVRHVRNADGLGAWLAGYFRAPVKIEQFVGHWMKLAEEDRTRLGTRTAGARLAVGAVLGARVWDRQHKFRVRIGPLSLERYENFLPGGTAIGKLVAMVRQYLCFELDWDLRLVLAREQVPMTVLARYGRLGWTTWLGRYCAQAEAADLTLDLEGLVARYGVIGPAAPSGSSA